MSVTKNDWRSGSKAVEPGDYIWLETPKAEHVFSWSPEPPGTVNAKCTQVHMHIGEPPDPVMVFRFKGTHTIDALIDALTEHREFVWGKR